MFKFVSIIALLVSLMVFNKEEQLTSYGQSSVLASDSLALVALYQSTNGNTWIRSWDLNQPISTWNGIGLREDSTVTRVVQIELENNNLTGKIPKQIGDLSALQILRLQRNKIDGFLPDEIVRLKALNELFLFNNAISGSLPDSIGSMTKVRMLSLARNQMTGPLPSSIGQMVDLRQLVLDQNQFSGKLPNSLTNLANLTFLDLHNNSFEGPLPDSLQLLSNIEEFLIHVNKFTGDIPISLAKLRNLTHFWANDNAFRGTLPDLGLVPLISLRIANNDITDLGDLHTITSLGINNPNGITAEQNQISFDDIIYHLDLIDSIFFTYAPQKEIQLEDTVLIRSGDPWIYQLPFDDTITTSSYKWFKNNQIVELTNDNRFIIPSVSKADEGLYRCTVNNRIITDMDLTTSSIRLVIKEASDCGNPPPADECFLTDVLCGLGELDNYCTDMDSLSNQERLSFCDHNFTLLDRDWFSFIAGEEDIRLRITPYNCSSNQNGGLVAWVFDNCNLGTPLNCDTICQRSTFEIALNNLNIGQVYYLLIGGCNGICSYEIDVRIGGSSLHLDTPNDIIGEDEICNVDKNYSYALDTSIKGATNYQWMITHPDTLISVIDSVLNIRWVFSGQYEMCVRAQNDCDTSEYLCRNIQVYPSIDISDHDSEIFSDEGVYSVNFKINGGTSPFTINGAKGTYNALNHTFTSDTISCGKRYLIKVSDVNGCEVTISGVEYCNCTSFAGEMSSEMIETCEFSAFKALHLGGQVLDTNDVSFFIFHEGTKNGQLGNIIDINTTGIFRFNEQIMILDTVYKVTFAVGNQLNGGGLQFNDPCLSLSNAQSVVFHKEPVANAGKDQLLCFGSFNLKAVKSEAGSMGNWQFIDGPKRPIINQPNSNNTNVTIDTPGIYLFRWLEIDNGCIGSDSVRVEVRPELTVKINGVEALCNGLKTELSVVDTFSSYLWSNGDSTASVTIDESGIYSVTITDNLGCTATSSKEILLEDSPVIVIEGDNKICSGQLFSLKAHDKFAKYEWSTGDTSRTITTNFEGVVCVTITDEKGCQSDDCVITKYKLPSTILINEIICFGDSLVIDSDVIKRAGHYEIILKGANNVGCDSTVVLDLELYPEIYVSDTLIIHDSGTQNGAISVSIEGGKRPFKYLWSNGKTSQFISQLKGGNYFLTVTDDNDCTEEFSFVIKSPVATKSIIAHKWKLDILPNIVLRNEVIRMVGSSEIPMDVNISIFNSSQQLFVQQKLGLKELEEVFFMNEILSPGLYFLVVRYKSQIIDVSKLMILE